MSHKGIRKIQELKKNWMGLFTWLLPMPNSLTLYFSFWQRAAGAVKTTYNVCIVPAAFYTISLISWLSVQQSNPKWRYCQGKKKKKSFSMSNFKYAKAADYGLINSTRPIKADRSSCSRTDGPASIVTGAQTIPTSRRSWSLNTCVAEHSTELALLDIIPSYQAPHDQLWGCQRQVIIGN